MNFYSWIFRHPVLAVGIYVPCTYFHLAWKGVKQLISCISRVTSDEQRGRVTWGRVCLIEASGVVEKEKGNQGRDRIRQYSCYGSSRWHSPRLRYRGECEDFDPKRDTILIPSEGNVQEYAQAAWVFKIYKSEARRVRPIAGVFPQEALVKRQFPHDPLEDLTTLSKNPPKFVPSKHLTQERLDSLEINGVNFLWPEEVRLFEQVMLANEAALAFEENERGTLREDYFSPYIMPTVEHVAWEEKNIPIPQGIKEQVIELLRHKMDAGVYEHCQSAYRSKWFCVLKKNGKLRLVHDLQALNAVSIRDAGGPPILDDFVEPFAGKQCYTVFDLFWGFDARRVHPDSRDLTAFATPLGLLRLTCMPMGYTNSPAEFQKCMVFILRDEIPHVANIFIDDLPIKGPATVYPDEQGHPEVLPENTGIRRFIWEHAVDVNRIMHRIKQAGATFSAKKTQICRPDVLIVGQRCTQTGRLPDTAKVEKILNWPLPKDATQIRGFLGLCGTVRIWIAGYSKLNRKLTELYKMEEIEWTPERVEAFEKLKAAVSAAPALRSIIYNSDNPVILAVDTSKDAIGIVLLQIDDEGRRRPARYGSIPLGPVEGRYSQPKLELYGLYRALRAFRLYLVGVRNLIVEVDAQSIKGMINSPDLQPNAAMNRWVQGIMLFDFTLKHVPGKTHLAADALSRRSLGEGEAVEEVDEEWLDNIALFVTPAVTPEGHFAEPRLEEIGRRQKRNPSEELPSLTFANTVKLDQDLDNIFRFLTELEAPPNDSTQGQKRFLERCGRYFVKAGKMWKRRQNGRPLLVIRDRERRSAILTESHENMGHRGEQAVFETVRERYYWPHLFADVKHHVKSCHPCQIRSTIKMHIPPTVSTPATLFTKIYVDVMHMGDSPRGHYHLVCARDDLSRACEARALRHNDSHSLMKFFWEEIYCRYGAVGSVVTDNGPEVQAAFMELTKRLNIPHVSISAYNKQANGVVERGHYIIREAIFRSCKRARDWPTKVRAAVFADRVTVTKSTGFSPFYILHGVHPVLPVDLADSTFLVNGFTSGMSSVDLLALRIRQLERREEDIALAAENLRRARFKSKEDFEKKYRLRMRREVYKKGELVVIRNSEQDMRLNRKPQPRYLGPFEIIRQTKGGSYVVKELDGTTIRTGFAAYRLLPYVSRYDKQLLKEIAREYTMAEREESTDEEEFAGMSDNSNDWFEDDEEEES